MDDIKKPGSRQSLSRVAPQRRLVRPAVKIHRMESAGHLRQSALRADREKAVSTEPAPASDRHLIMRIHLKQARRRFKIIFGNTLTGTPFLKDARTRGSMLAGVLLLVLAELTTMVSPYLATKTYALGAAGSLLPAVSQPMAAKLRFDAKQQAFAFNDSRLSDGSGQQASGIAGKQASATVYQDASKGLSVSDPIHKVDFTIRPTFSLEAGKQDGNRVVYPLSNGDGWAVYAMHGIGVKEDVLLNRASRDQQVFTYDLQLGDNLLARAESDGSIGVYGNTLFSGTIATGSDKDAALLQKARHNAAKDTLLFRIPAPTIIENGKKTSAVKAAYRLDGSRLQVNVSRLTHASYPLSIDPSIYVVTAQQFMNGNNETNIDFDVADKLIEKGKTTGARFDSWNTTRSQNSTTWRQGATVAGGYMYTVGGLHPANNQTNYTAPGNSTFVVPSGVTNLTVKMWGGGGGGGGGGVGGVGGAGGGSGFTQASLTVTAGETLNVAVGGGGGGGPGSGTSGGGGGGGGYSRIDRSGTSLIVAAGGAGGGGGGRSGGTTGGAGGAGGGTTGVTGGNGSSATSNGGGGGTASAGGGGGASSANAGSAGTSLQGGAGADGRSSTGANGGANNGGVSGGGAGGLNDVVSRYSGGGGGGGGLFGGGGGGGTATTQASAAGGGGGSSMTTGTGTTNTAGSGTTPGNSADTDRGTAGSGGGGGGTTTAGTAGNAGIIIITYTGTASALSTVSWAQMNTSTGALDNPDPGSGTCGSWCTSSAYNLPSGRSGLSLVAYNGFLYAIGGVDSSGTPQSSVYISKLGANGEPQLWHPTDSNKANWVYWYQDTNLSSTRAYTAAVAYNNRMYLLGGLSASNAVVGTVEVANLNPTGTLGTWASSTALPANLYGHGAQVYNDRLYVLGGASSVGGAPLNSVYYIKINSDGTLNNWIQTTSFSTGRMSNGGNFSTVWGAYLYISSGCSVVNASGYCTTVQADTQLASINADGSLDVWNTNASVSDTRMSHNLLAWRNYIYEIGGCTAQDSTTGDCTNALSSIKYGTINQDGDASTVGQSAASGTAPCSGATPAGCNLPGTANIGNLLNAAVITNGYLYVIGGCTNNTCSTTSANVAYVSISSTGIMTKPAACPNGGYQGGDWCVDNVNTITTGLFGTTGIAATSPVVFGGRIYLVGGLDGTANTNVIYRTTINSDGSITAWSNQSMTGVGANSVSYQYAYARANPSSAGTNPGNLYIFGGCTSSSSAGCTAYSQNVYKCNIQAAGTIAGCSTTGQLQIGIVPGDTVAGLGIMSGTVYANYVYLIGGVSPNVTDLKTVRYAKLDNNNNIVAVSGGAWIESPNQMAVGRRRAAAFGYNGYIYVVGGYDGSGGGVLADIEFIKVNVSDGSLGSATNGFHVSAVTINQRWGLSVPVSNSYAYVIGGCTVGASPGSCTTRTDVVQTFQVYNNDSGSPAGYSTSANSYGTSPNRIGASSVILNGYLYVAGGCTSATDCTTAISDVSYAPIDANGALGTWASTTAALPAVRTWGKLLAAGGTLYYAGGQSSTATDERSEVYYGTPSSGNVTTWGTASNGLPAARAKFGAAVWNNRLYVVGGLDASSAATATVYVSPQQSGGGNITSAWSTGSTAFSVARSGPIVIAYANNLYVMGGYDGSNYLSDTQYSQLSTSTGNSGSWTYSTSLPKPLSQGDGFAANGYMYLLGGRSADTVCDPVMLAAPISANTTIASGNNPTGIGEWYQTNQRYTGARYGSAAAYYDGKAYVLGGGCGTTLTYASPATQQTAVLSQPQVAKYSIMMDTDSDVFPTKWLLNGIDNSIGARWQLKYRSMTNTTTSCTSPAMTTWGQETNFGNVTLGLPGVYIPKDASGNNTNCARFFYFNVTVDSSQAFGYPDDVTRGPTITDLTLQFTADPSKRLMHGRTFTGGLQQPDDTPYYAN